MPDWIIKLLDQLGVVMAASAPFAAAVVIASAVIWIAINWSYSAMLNGKDAQIQTKIAEIQLLERQVADWKQKTEKATPEEAKARIDELKARTDALERRRHRRTAHPRPAFGLAVFHVRAGRV
jgi:FtsZ-binding cell division protein ZapB